MRAGLGAMAISWADTDALMLGVGAAAAADATHAMQIGKDLVNRKGQRSHVLASVREWGEHIYSRRLSSKPLVLKVSSSR